MREKRLPPPTASEAAFLQLVQEFGTTTAAVAPSEAGAFLDDLYAKAKSFLSRDAYATIGDASGFNTKVVGVSFEGRQDTVAALRHGETVELRRDPGNPHDPSAVGVWYGALRVAQGAVADQRVQHVVADDGAPVAM